MSHSIQPQGAAAAESARSPASLQRDAMRSVLESPLHNVMNRLATQGEFDVSALQQQLRRVCADAKRQGVRAEQVLIAVKEIWAKLPDARERARDADGIPVWNRIVALTLDEYFESSNPNI